MAGGVVISVRVVFLVKRCGEVEIRKVRSIVFFAVIFDYSVFLLSFL